jgi:phosphorylcholine metabolism protein LicD
MSLQDKIFELLKKTVAMLERNNIDYYIDGGTLLGAKRDGEIIKWDDDADIIILGSLKDVEKTDNLDWLKVVGGWKLFDTKNEYPVKTWKLHCQNVKKNNIKLSRPQIYKEGSKTYVKGAKCDYSVPFIDVNVIDYDDDGYLKYIEGNKQYWGTMHKVSTVFPLTEIEIRGTKFKAPNNIHQYLMTEYGEYWTVKKYNHGFNKEFKQKDMPDQNLQWVNHKPKIIKKN